MEAKSTKAAAGRLNLRARIGRISWRDLGLTLGPFLVISLVAIWIALRFVQPAPPDTIVMTSGPEESTFHRHAERYRKILARNGVNLEILPSLGSVQNLERLSDPAFRVDVGLVQGGLAKGADISNLVSLGSVFYQPLMVFYRGAVPVQRAFRAGRQAHRGRRRWQRHACACHHVAERKRHQGAGSDQASPARRRGRGARLSRPRGRCRVPGRRFRFVREHAQAASRTGSPSLRISCKATPTCAAFPI